MTVLGDAQSRREAPGTQRHRGSMAVGNRAIEVWQCQTVLTRRTAPSAGLSDVSPLE